MIPPPPSSTLFPYTTLFRSRQGGADAAVVADGPAAVLGHVEVHAHQHPLAAQVGQVGDRKSTRLNSSHLGISYAVFCLKKKKKKTNKHTTKQERKLKYQNHR